MTIHTFAIAEVVFGFENQSIRLNTKTGTTTSQLGGSFQGFFGMFLVFFGGGGD